MSRGKTIDSDHFNRRLPTYNYKTAVQEKKAKKKVKKSGTSALNTSSGLNIATNSTP